MFNIWADVNRYYDQEYAAPVHRSLQTVLDHALKTAPPKDIPTAEDYCELEVFILFFTMILHFSSIATICPNVAF